MSKYFTKLSDGSLIEGGLLTHIIFSDSNTSLSLFEEIIGILCILFVVGVIGWCYFFGVPDFFNTLWR